MGGSPIDPSSRASSELSLNPASASDQDNNGSNGVNCNDVANNGSRSPRFSVDVSFDRHMHEWGTCFECRTIS